MDNLLMGVEECIRFLSLLEGPLSGGRMKDFLGWSAGKTMLGGSFFALLLMLKEKSIG